MARKRDIKTSKEQQKETRVDWKIIMLGIIIIFFMLWGIVDALDRVMPELLAWILAIIMTSIIIWQMSRYG